MSMPTKQSHQPKDQEEHSRRRRVCLGGLGKVVSGGVNIVGGATKALGTGVVQGTKVSYPSFISRQCHSFET